MRAVRFDPLRAAVRASRRVYHRLRGHGIPLVYDARYQRSVYGVPIDPLRGDKVLGALEEAGLLARDLLSEPRPASLQNLLRVHTPEYLDAVQEPETLTRILGVEMPAREVEATLDLQRLMTGGTIQATRLALRTGGIAVHLGGGFHHALADAGLGFCVFNDMAVAIRRLRARGFAEPVLVVDLDLHDGNGTRRIFAEDPTVHTLSIHNEHWGDTDALASTAIALGSGVEDARLPRRRCARRCRRVVRGGRPRARDLRRGHRRRAATTRSATGACRAAGLLERDRLVTSLVRPDGRGPPMVVVLAGGYGRHAWRHTRALPAVARLGPRARARRRGGPRAQAVPPARQRSALRGDASTTAWPSR